MTRPKRLSATFVRTVKEPGSYGDGRGGHGLTLYVRPQASGAMGRYWVQRLTIAGRRTNIGLGSFPVVTLREARAKALKNRRAVARGDNPRAGAVPTFEAAAETVIRLQRRGWKGHKTEAQWRANLATYVFPQIGAKTVDAVTSADVLAVLAPIWTEKPVVAKNVRHRIGAVMRWAMVQGHRKDNPAGDAIGAVLPKNGKRVKHHKALPHAAVAKALRSVAASGGWLATKLAIRFVVLTAARQKEALGARWTEIDTGAALWTIPADRMKEGREHRVPLSRAALAVLAEARKLQRTPSGYIFAKRDGGQLYERSAQQLFSRLHPGYSLHGTARSCFRQWAAETGDVSREVAEAALAHVAGSKVEQAYQRSDLLAARAGVMERWAEYLGAQ